MSCNDHSRSAEARLKEAEVLIWALLDEQLDDDDAQRLSRMLEDDAAIRARYIDCVQLHVDLNEHFGRKLAERAKGTVVLQHLASGVTGLPGMPQIAE